MAKARDTEVVVGRWRIVETSVWDQGALDLVVHAHITFGRNGLGEMQLIAIGASIDYRVERRADGPVVEFSWSGFDDDNPTSGRAAAKVDGDTMRGKLFIHQGDDSTFIARRETLGQNTPESKKRSQRPAGTQKGRVPAGPQHAPRLVTPKERALLDTRPADLEAIPGGQSPSPEVRARREQRPR